MKFFNKETIVYFIAVMVTMTWTLTTFFLIGKALKLVGENADLTAVLSIYATITAVFMNIQSFYFGSTKGSQERTAQMVEMAKSIPVQSSAFTNTESDQLKMLRLEAKNAGVLNWETATEVELKAALGKN